MKAKLLLGLGIILAMSFVAALPDSSILYFRNITLGNQVNCQWNGTHFTANLPYNQILVYGMSSSSENISMQNSPQYIWDTLPITDWTNVITYAGTAGNGTVFWRSSQGDWNLQTIENGRHRVCGRARDSVLENPSEDMPQDIYSIPNDDCCEVFVNSNLNMTNGTNGTNGNMTKIVGEPKYQGREMNGTLIHWFITNNTPIALTCNGNLSYRLNNGSLNSNLSNVTLRLSQAGINHLDYSCNNQNYSETDYQDSIAPITSINFDSENITFNCTDNAVGCNSTFYRMGSNFNNNTNNTNNNNTNLNFSGTIFYYSIDNLGNVEDEKNFSMNFTPSIEVLNPTQEEVEIQKCVQSIVVKVNSSIGIRRVYAELFQNNTKVKEENLTRTIYGTYEALMDNELPAGSYILKIKAENNFGGIGEVNISETLKQGVFVEYIENPLCSINPRTGGNCSFTFNLCVRNTSAIKMWMNKLGGIVTPAMMNASIEQSYVGLMNNVTNLTDAGMLQFNSTVNGRTSFNLNLNIPRNVASMIGIGEHSLEYMIKSFLENATNVTNGTNGNVTNGTNGNMTNISYSAVLQPCQANTSIISNASGFGNFIINTANNTVTYHIVYSNLSSNETVSHIHGFAMPGIEAPPVHNLQLGNVKDGVWHYNESQENQILLGLTYVNIHSSNYPNGEIRGQIMPFNFTCINGNITNGTNGNMTMNISNILASYNVSGSYILATPTDGANSSETSGIWFLSLPGPEKGLNLPELNNTGLIYEGWIYKNGRYFSTGKFLSAENRDNFSGYSSTMPFPSFPGEDFLVNAPNGIVFPLNLSGSQVYISVELVNDNDNIPNVIIMEGNIPTNAQDHVNYNLTRR